MTVTVALPINRTRVYHTENCMNCREIATPREITLEKANRLDLVECVHCKKAYERQHEQETKHYRALRDADTLDELSEELNASD